MADVVRSAIAAQVLPVRILGPAPGPVARLKGSYRFHFQLSAPGGGGHSAALALGGRRAEAGWKRRIHRRHGPDQSALSITPREPRLPAAIPASVAARRVRAGPAGRAT